MSMKMNAGIKRLAAVCLIGILMLGGAVLAEETAVESVAPERSATAVSLTDEQIALWDEMLAEYGVDVNWPLDVWAEYSRRSEALGISIPGEVVYDIPAEDDVQLDEALETATQCLLESMGFKEEMLGRFAVYSRYIITDPQNPEYNPHYMIVIYPIVLEDYAEIGSYFCIVDGKTGEVLLFETPADAKG